MAKLEDLWSGWRDAGRAEPFVLIDCAGFEGGAADMPRDAFSQLECLFTGDLAEELKDVAPYLAAAGSYDPVVRDTIGRLLEEHLAVVVMPLARDEPLTFSEVHRHFRKHNVVYGPDGQPLFFRYYDPRALLDVLDSFDGGQLDAFFGPTELLVMNDREGQLVRCWRQSGALAVGR
jgi:hypothetical protein